MLVREVMSNEAITVPLGTSVKSALAMLASARITSLPVVSAGGKLRGIVSEADLIRDAVSADGRLHEIPLEDVLIDRHQYVDDVMTTLVLTVGPDSDLTEAVDLMTSTGVKSVPVVARNGRVLGVVSRSDVVALLARADQDLERDVDSALASVGLHDWLVEVNDGTVELVAPARAVDDRGLARVVAGTVPGVAAVHVSSSG
jgi:CBS domain-containing protein